MKQRAKRRGGVIWTDPLYMVETQLKTFTPLGTATMKVSRENTKTAMSLMPLVNM